MGSNIYPVVTYIMESITPEKKRNPRLMYADTQQDKVMVDPCSAAFSDASKAFDAADDQDGQDASLHVASSANDSCLTLATCSVGNPHSGAKLAVDDDAPPPNKICGACKVLAAVPSPLCPGKYREWGEVMYYGSLCKPCLLLLKLRYFNAISPARDDCLKWICSCLENTVHFLKRFVAYVSLKLELVVVRVTITMLEQRVKALEVFFGWMSMGPSVGMPQQPWFQQYVTLDLKAADELYRTNIFLAGGQAT